MAPLINFIAPAAFRSSFTNPQNIYSRKTRKCQPQHQHQYPYRYQSTRMVSISPNASKPDVLVIGGGIIGLSSALELAAGGANVCVLTRDFEESASRNAAGMLGAVSEGLVSGPLSVLAKESTKLYPDFIANLRASSHNVSRVSHVSRDDFLTPYLSHEINNIPSDAIKGDVLRGIEPALGEDVVAARRIHGDSHLDNRQLLRSLADTCNSTGNIDIRRGVDVQHLQSDASSGMISYAITTKGEIFHADHYLVTTGAWTHKLLPNIPVRPVKGQMMSLSYDTISDDKNMDTMLPNHVLHGSELYIVPKRHLGLYFIGATVEDNSSFSRNTTAQAALQLLKAAIKYVPGFSRCEIREHWAGLRPATPDLMPIIGSTSHGEHGYGNLSVATGTYRNGVLFAPAVAKLAAACVAGKQHELGAEMRPLLEAFSLQRFYDNQYQAKRPVVTTGTAKAPVSTPVIARAKAMPLQEEEPAIDNNDNYIPQDDDAKNEARELLEENLLNEAIMQSASSTTPSYADSTPQNGTVLMSMSEMEDNLLREANNAVSPPPSPPFITGISTVSSQNGADHSTPTPSQEEEEEQQQRIGSNNNAPDSAAPILMFRTRPDGVQEPVRPSARYLKRMTGLSERSTAKTTTATTTTNPPPPPLSIPTSPVSTSKPATGMGTSNNAYDDVLQHRDQAEEKLREGLLANRNFLEVSDISDGSTTTTSSSSPTSSSSTAPVSLVPVYSTTTKNSKVMGTSNNAYDDVLQHRDQAEEKLREGLQANRNFVA